ESTHVLQYAGMLLLVLCLLSAFARQGAWALFHEYLEEEIVCDDKTVNRLLVAVQQGSPRDVEAALRAGADVDATGGACRTALMRAAAGGHIRCCEVLCIHGANVNAETYYHWTPIMLAALERQSSAVRWLIDHGANVNHRTPSGVTPLLVAARSG